MGASGTEGKEKLAHDSKGLIDGCLRQRGKGEIGA